MASVANAVISGAPEEEGDVMVGRTAGPAGTGIRHPVQTAAAVVGAVFLLVGVLGFIPGITSSYDQLALAGHGSGAMLLGLFQVSVLHNLVHLAFGVAGIILARTVAGARNYLIWGGVVYAVLWLYGLVIPHDGPANFVPLNTADNWLHVVLAIGMIGLGVVLGRRPGDGR
jgi:4-hydroxybenzoate polyprenyltransferase